MYQFKESFGKKYFFITVFQVIEKRRLICFFGGFRRYILDNDNVIILIFLLGGDVPNILQEVQVPIVANSECQMMFYQAGHQKAIQNNFVCAGYTNGGQDSCEVIN